MLETVISAAGDQVIKLDDSALVSSKSRPGNWHKTTATTCDCPGFYFRRDCRHIRAVLELERQARAATTADREAKRAAIVASVSDLFD